MHFLKEIKQDHLIKECVNQSLLADQVEALQTYWEGGPYSEPDPISIKPLSSIELPSSHFSHIGDELLKRGKVGVVILAAGLGTRLGHMDPKGTFLVGGKSLFEWHIDKIIEAQKTFRQTFPIAFLLSAPVYEKTCQFFEKNEFFGLEKSQICLLVQKEYPYFDESGRLFLTKEGHLAVAPNGNGGLFDALINSSFLEKSFDYLQVIAVDNPLADPLDRQLSGCASHWGASIVVQAIDHRRCDEKMGLVVEKNGKIAIQEYTTTESIDFETYANTGHYCFEVNFLKNFLKMREKLPLHWVKKEILFENQKKRVYKGEKYIFDILPFSNHTRVLCESRAHSFAPLKSLEGPNGIEATLSALEAFKMAALKADKDQKQ